MNTLKPTKFKVNPFVIRRALSYVCQGYTYEDTVRLIAKKHRTTISVSAVCKWVKQFNPPYLEIRHINKGYDPIIRSYLHAYPAISFNFQVHLPKLNKTCHAGLKKYLSEIANEFNDSQFTDKDNRCSLMRLSVNAGIRHLEDVPVNRLAAKAIDLALSGYNRHTALEEYFIACDKHTIAIEVPVVADIPDVGPVIGRIDLLQYIGGALYILDYKPNARKTTPGRAAGQLALYASALVHSTGLRWEDIRCAYFDETDYYSFKPSQKMLTQGRVK